MEHSWGVVMENKEKLFIENVNTYLEKAEFNHDSITKEEVQLTISQRIDVLYCDEDSIKIKMVRSANPAGEDKHIVYVSAIAIFNLSRDSFNNFSNLSEMKEYVKQKAGFLVDKIQMGSELSKIIANLTGTFGNPPLILPPIMNEENMKPNK